MKYVYITALIDLAIKGVMKAPAEIRPNFFVSNNPAHIRRFLKPHDLLALGSLEANLLLNGSPVVYRVGDADDVEVAHTETVNFLRDVQGFLASLWLIRDNSANCELGFAVAQSMRHIHSNSLVFNYSAASGERVTTEIDQAQLLDVITLCRENFIGLRRQDELNMTAFQREAGRLNIAMLFLQQARSSNDLGQKIANYCSYFEALLSTSSAELTHQLSERAAFLLRSDPHDRLDIFKKMKRAYAIRSKVVHGDVVSRRQLPDLREIAQDCDQTARDLLLWLIASGELINLFDSGDNEALDDFMLKRVFGVEIGLPHCNVA